MLCASNAEDLEGPAWGLRRHARWDCHGCGDSSDRPEEDRLFRPHPAGCSRAHRRLLRHLAQATACRLRAVLPLAAATAATALRAGRLKLHANRHRVQS
ncbi:hypothetical protein ACFUN7_27720 [Streptomyces sp. NPDC057236]|uniref:hypothetical protein n=1 Tax=Streptomyces sp. NPDC057236 TaxID=3346059 RepID=UPI003627786B